MFGYIRPLQGELKIREFEQFRSCYCSLCRELKDRYGITARFILNYDFVFLTMLLWEENEEYSCAKDKCPLHPIKSKCICRRTEATERCAGYSVILTYWKLRDSVADDGFFRSFPSRISSLLLKRAYKKAALKYPGFENAVRGGLEELTSLEKQNEPSMDKMADKFANILCAAAHDENETQQRIKRQLLYHMGRWIYILDAVNDIEEDDKRGNYNPLAVRYGLNGGKLDDETKNSLEITLKHSVNMIISAYELLPENCWKEIIRNIIYLGMPAVSDSVFDKSTARAGTDRREI